MLQGVQTKELPKKPAPHCSLTKKYEIWDAHVQINHSYQDFDQISIYTVHYINIVSAFVSLYSVKKKSLIIGVRLLAS